MEKLYTVRQAADLLQVTEKGVRKWLTEGKLKGYKLGKSWRIPESAINDFLQERQNTPAEQDNKNLRQAINRINGNRQQEE